MPVSSSDGWGDRLARDVWRLVPQRFLSELIGLGARCPIPKSLRPFVLGTFARSYGIDLIEAEHPLSTYASADEFFTRCLRPGLRPIADDEDVIVSPADGKVVSSGIVDRGTLLQAKGTSFGLADLLCDADASRRLEGGAYLITYLSPRDYHRVHAPVAGEVVAWHHVPGDLFPVNAGSVRREPGLFARNERFVTLIESDIGLCAVVMVAAVGVGHMTATYDATLSTHEGGFAGGEVRSRRFEARPRLERGGELGIFHLGSTTVVIFEPKRADLRAFLAGESTRMGEAIGRMNVSSVGTA